MTIGNNVWIGDKAYVMSRIKIGNGYIVATDSIITRDVPPIFISSGITANLIKYRFSDSILKTYRVIMVEDATIRTHQEFGEIFRRK